MSRPEPTHDPNPLLQPGAVEPSTLTADAEAARKTQAVMEALTHLGEHAGAAEGGPAPPRQPGSFSGGGRGRRPPPTVARTGPAGPGAGPPPAPGGWRP
jgi:hypothetical protein